MALCPSKESRGKQMEPSKPAPRTHLSREQLTEYWYVHLEKVDAVVAARYRQNRVLFPMSRHDLIEYYTQWDLRNFKLEGE
jgi:hypothetical protein